MSKLAYIFPAVLAVANAFIFIVYFLRGMEWWKAALLATPVFVSAALIVYIIWLDRQFWREYDWD